MGKKETKQALKDSQRLQREAQEKYDKLVQESKDRANAGTNPAATGSEGESSSEGEGGGEGGGGGGVMPRGYWGGFGGPGEGSVSTDQQRDFLTGGYLDIYSNIKELDKPEKIESGELKETLGEYKKFRDTGGITKENVERIRGLGGFDEFAKTGGYSPEAIANIKAQALAPIGSFASGTRDELARRAAVQGGYSPGFDAAGRQLQRDASRAIADTSLAANVGIQDRVNQGRMWGLSGVSSTEAALAEMQNRNRLMGLGGEQGIGTNLSNISAQDIQNLTQRDLFNIQNSQNMKLAGLGGLGGLYEGSMGRQENAYDRELRSYENSLDRELTRSESALGRSFAGSQAGYDRQQQEYNRQMGLTNSMFGNQLGGLQNQTQLAMQPGIGGNLVNLAGAAAGIGANLMTGGASGLIGGAIGAGMKGAKGIGSAGAAFDPYRGFF